MFIQSLMQTQNDTDMDMLTTYVDIVADAKMDVLKFMMPLMRSL